MAGIIKTEDTASEAESISEEERIRKLFQACDGDGDGYIDSEDLLSICRKLNLEQCVGELMQELGADDQGRISYQGFLRRRLELAGQVEAASRCLGEEETTTEEEEEGGGGGRADWGLARDDKNLGNDNNRQSKYRQPTSSENSLGAGSGGRQERWEFDSGARDLSPEPQASPGGIRGQSQTSGQGLQGPPNIQGGPSISQGPGVAITQGGTASLLDMANKLHLAALSSLKSEIQDLTGQLKAVTQERDFLERSLNKAQLEKVWLVHDAEERLDSQAQRYEGRLTELHCVIAELSRKIRGQTSRVITEEEEEEEDDSTTTAADDEEGEGIGGDLEEEEDGAGSQSVAADTTQDDLSGVGGEEEGVETETQDCCELESGRTELVDGEGTVVPDDATDHTHMQDLVVAQREEEEGLEQQRRLHRKVKELQGNLQQLQIIAPAVVSVPPPPPTTPKRAVRHAAELPCCAGGGCQVDSRRRGECAKHKAGKPPLCPLKECGNAVTSERVDLKVCFSRTAECIIKDIQHDPSAQDLQLAVRYGSGSLESIDPAWESNEWRRRRVDDGGIKSPERESSVARPHQMESPPVGEQEVVAAPCGCLPILRALELEVERQAGRAESHRASAELASLSLDECRSACEHQALLLGRRGSDIVGLATAVAFALPLCRATYILSRLLYSQEATAGHGRSETSAPKSHTSEFQAKEGERSRSKRRQSSGGASPQGAPEPERSWLCRKREEGGRREGVVVDEGGGYGRINRTTVAMGGAGEGGAHRALEMEAAAFVETLDQKIRLLSLCECRTEEVTEDSVAEREPEENWVLSRHDFLWLESLGIEEEDGSPDILRRLGRYISVLLKKLSACGISLQKAKMMAAEASASEGVLGLLPLDVKSETQRPHSSSPEGRKADLEVAVLMQELMAMREERAALRVRLHLLEGEKEELGRLCELLKPSHSAEVSEGMPRPLHAAPATKDNGVGGGESATVDADGATGATSQEQWLEGRLQELALALEQVATSANLRLRQSTAVMNDLRRTNGTLAHSLDRCRRRYQQRLKTLEGQMESLVERHASQVRTLRQRISQLEEKGSSVDGGTRGGQARVSAMPPCPAATAVGEVSSL